MKRIYFITVLATFICTNVVGQMQKRYHDNGKIAFEGNVYSAWSEIEVDDLLIDPSENTNMQEMNLRHMSRMNSFLPKSVFEGFCKFYFNNGQLSYAGNYVNGFKEGKFEYYYPTGELKAIKYYWKGMGTGKWKYFDKNKNLLAIHNYKHYESDFLKNIDYFKAISVDKNHDIEEEQEKKYKPIAEQVYSTWETKIYDRKNLITTNHKSSIEQFEEYIDDKLLIKTMRHGDFYAFENNKPILEMHYTNNVPSKTWKIFEDGKVIFEMSLEKGEVKYAKDYKSNAKDAANQLSQPLRTASDAAKFNQNLHQYFEQNIIYPEIAKQEQIQGTVGLYVKINEDASIDPESMKIYKNVSRSIDAEAIRVLKNMPKWSPAKQNGKPYAEVINIQVPFVLKK